MTMGGKTPLASKRLHDRFAFLHAVVHLRDGVGDDGIARGFARDVERLQNRNAAGDQRAERARKSRDRGLAKEIAEERHAQFDPIDERRVPPGRGQRICTATIRR